MTRLARWRHSGSGSTLGAIAPVACSTWSKSLISCMRLDAPSLRATRFKRLQHLHRPPQALLQVHSSSPREIRCSVHRCPLTWGSRERERAAQFHSRRRASISARRTAEQVPPRVLSPCRTRAMRATRGRLRLRRMRRLPMCFRRPAEALQPEGQTRSRSPHRPFRRPPRFPEVMATCSRSKRACRAMHRIR